MDKILARYDIKGIQDYIFSSDKVKENVGASIREIILENDTVEYRISPDEKPDLKTLDHHQLGCSQKVWDDFLMITNLNHQFELSEYPNNIDKPENFHWFAANKQISTGDGLPDLKEYQGRGGTGTSPVIEQTLPPIKSPWLYKYKEKKQEK